MLADLHSITVFQDPKQLRENIIETAAVFLACGLDPKKNVIFCQSSVGGHSELAWIFNCVARIGWLNRMTQFKEKAGSNKEKASVGLYSYPTLMAADILLYKATHVPVGEDQKQHLELCRDIAVKFNNDFNCKDFFTLPEPIITKEVARIMSLKDGTKKMSKSDESEASRINLTDTEEDIVQKIKKAKTDNDLIPDTESKLADRPEARNLINIFSILNNNTIEKTLKELNGKNFSELKNKLSEALIKEIIPIGKKIKEVPSVTKQLFTKSYWTKVNIIEFWAFSTKLAIIFPGLLFGKQWWWLFLFALTSSLALIATSTIKTLPTIIYFNVGWSILATVAIIKHFV